MTVKTARYMLVAVLLVVMAVTSGCTAARGARAAWRYYEHKQEEPVTSQKVDEENKTRWRRIAVPKGEAPRQLYMDLPFDLESHSRLDNSEQLVGGRVDSHYDGRYFVGAFCGVLKEKKSKVNFDADSFFSMIKGLKEPKVVKQEERQVEDKQMLTHIECQAVSEDTGEQYHVDLIGAQRKYDIWMIIYAYPANDKELADMTKRTIDSIKILGS